MSTNQPPPPEGRFGQWAYLLWDWVQKNRGGYANEILGSNPVVVTTSGTSTYSISHATSGVTAGTYGTGNTVPTFAVDSRGHLTTAAGTSTLGTFARFNSFVLAGIATGTTTTGTLTAARTLVAAGAVLGTTTTGTLTTALATAYPTVRALEASAPVAVATAAGTYTVSHNTSGVTAGTFGNGTAVGQVVVDAQGHVTFGSAVDIAFPTARAVEGATPILVGTAAGTYSISHGTSGVAAGTFGAAGILAQVIVDARGHVTGGSNAGTLGTFAGFNSLAAAGVITGTTTTGTLTAARAWTDVLAGDALGTSSTGTLTVALSTTGVTAGTYGNSTAVSQVTVDAKGRVSAASNVEISFPAARALEASAPIAVSTTAGTYTLSHTTSGAAAGTYGTGGTMVSQVTVDARGHITGISNQGISFPAATGTVILGGDALGTGALNGTTTVALSTTGVVAGTYGAPTIIPRFDIDAKGRMLSASNIGTLGTFGGFNALALAGYVTGTTTTGTLTAAYAGTLVAAGDALGTSTTGTLTAALSTTGVTAGTYGNSTAVSQFVVDAKGRLTSGANVNIAYPSAREVEGSAPIAVATAAGTYTVSHNTSGVAAGTLGGASVLAQLVVDARGHLTSGTNAGTLGTFAGFNSYVVTGAVTGTSTTGTLTTALSTTPRALEATAPLAVTTGAGTYTLTHNTSGVAASTYGNSTAVGQFVVDARGHLSSASAVSIAFPPVVGTSYFTGDVFGTAPLNGTGTTALSTTGVTAGTYGDGTAVSQIVVDAKGRLSSASSVTISFPTARVVEGTAPISVTTGAGTFVVAHDTSGVVAGTYGGTAGFPRFDISARGHVLSGTNIAVVATSPILVTTAAGTMSWSHGTSGVTAGTYSQVVVDARGHVTVGGTATSASATWQVNKDSVEAGTLSIAAGYEIVFGQDFTLGSGGVIDNSGQLHIY